VSIAIVVVNIKDDYVPLRRKKAEGGSAKGPGLFGALRKAPLLTLFILLLFFFDFCYSQWNFMLPAQFGDRYAENGARLYSALSSVNAVTVIFMTPLITRLTRRLPPLKAVALSGLFFLVSYIGFAFEGSFALCFVLAVVFTLGEICSAVQIGAYVSNSAPPDCLGRINSFSTLVRGAASAVGPMAMGQLLTQVNYTTGWLVTAAIVLAAGIGMFALNTLGDKGRYKNEVQ
jgi:MFS family permease